MSNTKKWLKSFLNLIFIALSTQSFAFKAVSSTNNIKITSIEINSPYQGQRSISLTANLTGHDGSGLAYQWQQNSGLPLKFKNNTQKTLLFTIPDTITNQNIGIELTIRDVTNNIYKRKVALIVHSVDIPQKRDSKIVVNEFSNVVFIGDITLNNKLSSSIWQQKSGTPIEIALQNNSGMYFKAPKVKAKETFIFEKITTFNNGSNTKEVFDVTVLPAIIEIPPHVLLLTEQRINKVKSKINLDSSSWEALISKIDNYYTKVPYNAGEYAGSFALAFYISGDVKYIQRAIELLEHAYFSEPDIGWQYYNSRNFFRVNARWAIMGYTWIKSYISEAQKTKIENILALWSNYWLEHVDYYNDYRDFRVEDTDNLTSLAENLTLLGYSLNDSSKHINLSQQLITAGDELLNRVVVGYYMKDIMAGGAWAEGSDYSPNTQRHWIRTFMINKDQRNIPYPANYAHNALQALIHQTLANYSGIYKYGSEEAATDYEPLSEDYRYEFALELMGFLEDPKDLAQLNQWFNALLKNEGFRKGSMITHFQRLLYHTTEFNGDNLPIYPENTINIAKGVGLVSSRTDWSENSTNLFFINRKLRVDHEHKDALSFDVAFQGAWISKESTGYSGAATTSSAHNTILIENATSDGSSSPTYRPAGDPKFYHVFDDEDISIISADATDTYNMTGYFATSYAKQVNRQIAFIKPSTIIVYDHVITDTSKIKDLIQYSDLSLKEGDQHTRWVKIIQHMQAEPLTINKNKTYQVVNEGKELVYQVHWPLDAKVNIVDETILWRDSLKYEMPENQKKWHFEVTNQEAIENNEFITSLNFGQNIEGVNYAIEPIIMTKENGLILKGSIKGIALKVNDKAFILLFDQTPQSPSTTVDYIRPPGFESAKVYAIGLDIDQTQ